MTLLDEILDFLHYHPHAKRVDVEQGISAKISPATIKRTLADGVASGLGIIKK